MMNIRRFSAIAIVCFLPALAVVAEEKMYEFQNRKFTEREVHDWYAFISQRYLFDGGRPVSTQALDAAFVSVKIRHIADAKTLLVDHGDTLVAVVIPEGTADYLKGEEIEGILMADGAYTYKTVTGANSQVPQFVALPMMTKGEFSSWLRRELFPEMIEARQPRRPRSTNSSVHRTPIRRTTAPRVPSSNQ